MKPLDEKALEAAAHVLHSQQELDYDWDRERDAFRSQAAEIIRAYMAALDPAPGWMPIETAPKHQDILVGGANTHGQWRCAVYRISNEHWRDEWEYTADEPTHWKPLPAAPMSQEG